MGALRSWLRPPWSVLRCWDGIGRCGRCRKVCGRRALLMLVVSQDDPADFALAAPPQPRTPGAQSDRVWQDLVAAALARRFPPPHLWEAMLVATADVLTVHHQHLLPSTRVA